MRLASHIDGSTMAVPPKEGQGGTLLNAFLDRAFSRNGFLDNLVVMQLILQNFRRAKYQNYIGYYT